MKIAYVCEKCGRRYSSPEVAKKCEKGHYYPEAVTQYDYGDSDKPQRGGWPERVVIGGVDGFGEGGTCEYIRTDIVSGFYRDDNEIPF